MKTPAIEEVRTDVYRVPTDGVEADGTFTWDATTLVVVHVSAGGVHGLGYTYGAAATGALIDEMLADRVRGRDAFDIPAAFVEMSKTLRNAGRPGIGAMAVAAVDTALWDLKARLLSLPLVRLLGQVREAIPLYGSGGFTSYPLERLARQLGEWAAAGFQFVKMKVGREPSADSERVRAAREAIGPDVGLFVDANGAYARKQALMMADAFGGFDVRWFEEPVCSDDLEGLRLLRDEGPPGMEIAAGEYGYEPVYFRRMLQAQAIDVLQADVTRCGGITGLLQVDALCRAFGVPLSAHTAPALHLHPCGALPSLVHLEYFHDHARIEQMLFDGAVPPRAGQLAPDLVRPGHGLTFKEAQAARYRI